MNQNQFKPSQTELVAEGNSLKFDNEKQQARFELGVSCAVFLWEDMTTAVDNQWGGPSSAEKREWTAGVILELFEERIVSVEDIEYRLLGIMEDEFDVTLETETAYQVAEQIVALYIACSHQQYALVEQLYEKYQSKSTQKNIVNVEGDDSDDGSDDDSASDCEMHDCEMKDQKPEPIIDDDGFELVQRRR